MELMPKIFPRDTFPVSRALLFALIEYWISFHSPKVVHLERHGVAKLATWTRGAVDVFMVNPKIRLRMQIVDASGIRVCSCSHHSLK